LISLQTFANFFYYSGNTIIRTVFGREVTAMLGFILGAMTGGTLGVVAMCLAQTAGEADSLMEQHGENK
jgi:hypothetical protein